MNIKKEKEINHNLKNIFLKLQNENLFKNILYLYNFFMFLIHVNKIKSDDTNITIIIN